MIYGKNIGKKFLENGEVRTYPGNTVIAKIVPGSEAHRVMRYLRNMVVEEGLGSYVILLPEDSYHMTVIRGVNDQVRTPAYWLEQLDRTAQIDVADGYISAAIARAGLPEPPIMRFAEVFFNNSCLAVRLVPADEIEKERLLDFRNRAAAEIGLYLPGHDNYQFHVTIGYTRIIPEGADFVRMEKLKKKMNAYLTVQQPFVTGVPYVAYYNNMLAFPSERR